MSVSKAPKLINFPYSKRRVSVQEHFNISLGLITVSAHFIAMLSHAADTAISLIKDSLLKLERDNSLGRMCIIDYVGQHSCACTYSVYYCRYLTAPFFFGIQQNMTRQIRETYIQIGMA